jgi:hypothetical protein
MNQIITSALGSINWRDALHGLYMAVLGAILSPLLQWIEALSKGTVMTLDWKQLGLTALGTGLTYLVKKFLTPAQIITPVSPSTTDVTK